MASRPRSAAGLTGIANASLEYPAVRLEAHGNSQDPGEAQRYVASGPATPNQRTVEMNDQ